MKKILSKISYSRLCFATIFSFALFFMNKIVYLGYTSAENYMDAVFFNEFSILLIIIPVVYYLLYILEKYYKKIIHFIILEEDFNHKALFCIVASIFLLLTFLAYYLTFYPGGIYIDTWTSLKMLTGEEPFTNHQPVLYTVMLSIVKFFLPDLYTGFGIFTLIQLLFMVATLVYFLYWLLNKKVNPIVVAMITFFFITFNLYPLYSISIWKDTPFSLALFLYTLTVIDFILDFKNHHITIAHIIKFNLFALLVAFLRNNGIYIIILTFLLLFLIFLKDMLNCKNIIHLKAFTISFIVVCLFTSLIQHMYPLMGIQPTEFVENLSIPIQQVARVVATDGNITEEQKVLIEKVIPIENIKTKYRALLVDRIKWDSQFNETYLEEHKAEYLQLWFSLFLQNPGEYFKAYLLQTSGFWTFHVRGQEAYASPVIWETLNSTILNKDLIDEYTVYSFKNDFLPQSYYSGGFFFWITLTSMFLTFKLNSHKKKYLLSYIPSLLLWLTIMVATPMGSALRYVYILVLMLPLNLVYPAMIQKEE